MTDKLLEQAIDYIENVPDDRDSVGHIDRYAVVAALKERLAQPEQEPVAFEEWLAKQHGDPEEIGFLQALRIAYLAGQDSITHPPQRNPLTDEQRRELMSKAWNKWLSNKDDGRLFAWDFSFEVEAAHGIKENT
jgi:hypothetical protein